MSQSDYTPMRQVRSQATMVAFEDLRFGNRD